MVTSPVSLQKVIPSERSTAGTVERLFLSVCIDAVSSTSYSAWPGSRIDTTYVCEYGVVDVPVARMPYRN